MTQPERRQPILATSILFTGAISHAFLCIPAIRCRGYPPIDPIWYGVTFVWPIAILISARFDSIQLGSRKTQLVVYSLITAFFTAGTIVTIVPHRMGPAQMFFGIIYVVPVHLIVAFTLEFVSQYVYAKFRHLDCRVDLQSTEIRSSTTSYLLPLFWVCLVVGVPLGFRFVVTTSIKNSAIERADSDWDFRAIVYREFELHRHEDCLISYYFDAETGLRLKHRSDYSRFA